MKFKKIVLTILSVTLMVSILATSALAWSDFGLRGSNGYSGQAYLSPAYASCSAKTVYFRNYGGAVPTSQSVDLQVKFVNESTINKPTVTTVKSGTDVPDAVITINSLLGSGFSWAESIHKQTIGGTTYRKDLSA